MLSEETLYWHRIVERRAGSNPIFTVTLEPGRHLVYAPKRPLAFVATDALLREVQALPLPSGNGPHDSTTSLAIELQDGVSRAMLTANRIRRVR